MIKDSAGYQANQAQILVALCKFTVPLLCRTYRAFDGDVVAAIVFGEIAHSSVEAWLAKLAHSEDPLRDPVQRETLLRPCTALSVAEACNIPRETVRRKVVALIERGYICRNEENCLRVSDTVGESFEGATQELATQLLATARCLETLLTNHRAPVGPIRLG